MRRNKNILITGTSGFIGFHLSRKLLIKGHKVHGFDSMNDYYDIKLKKDRLKILKSERDPIYNTISDYIIDVSTKDKKTVVEEIKNKLL